MNVGACDIFSNLQKPTYCLHSKRNSAMSMSNSMAFISQFGEYNPGGGKDEVLKYLEESKKQVILAEKALKRILDTVESAKK